MDPVTEVIDKAFAAALYADGDEGLDTGASLLAAAPEADEELRRRGEELVRRAWERGWQPADVIRMITKTHQPHQTHQATQRHHSHQSHQTQHLHLAADLITAETRRYGDTLPPRWRAQLDELAPKGGRPHTPTDRFSQATTALSLYRLLLRLPAIEPVGPAPGTPLHAPPPPGHDEPRILTRIRALLAKAEATGFPEEAEALTAKAQELMARHTIDEALLASRTHAKDRPGACRIGVDAPYETAKAILLDAVASANRCRAVWNEAYGFSTVVGFEPDLEVVELLHTSLLVQGTAAMTKAEAGLRAGGRKRTKTFRQAFLLAYANRLGTRLASAARDVTAESPEAGELLPVLAARDVAVTSHAERMFPETTTTRVRGAVDQDGWNHGTTAADRAHMTPGQRHLP
ncbi:DUF2786 domain-containing protein [Streptomyces sp. NPDC048436]|uniref:DUF2786 domain-containing protein n=1 Tax=Streptomyces sp. NPDC048436 TaxID=3365550 RepID=UPI003715AF2F